MPDVELPEAKNPFERRVALTIAILAVVLSFVDNKGDNAKTDAIVTTNEASNQWAYYQSKSLKQNLAESNATMLELVTAVNPATAKVRHDEMLQEIARYEVEKKQIKAEAEKLEASAAHSMTINDRCDGGSLLLQISVILCSIAILVEWPKIYHAGAIVGLIGIAVGTSAFFM